jgi:hypothetical protein
MADLWRDDVLRAGKEIEASAFRYDFVTQPDAGGQGN